MSKNYEILKNMDGGEKIAYFKINIIRRKEI